MSRDENELRATIRAAMDRLLAGIPLRSDGALTVVSLAVEADDKRHVLTHRHVDLKDEFYARVRAAGGVPESERRLREDLAETRRQLKETQAENQRLAAEIEEFARVVNVLSVENHQLRQVVTQTSNLRPLPSRPGLI